MRNDLAHHLLPVVEAAAIASARTMGRGDRKHCDRVAVEAMRRAMDDVPMRGRIVIGEGERDEAPMLWIGEEVGRRGATDARIDIAVDPLEGTNLCATGAPSSICVLAAAEAGGLLHAPDCYMDKIVVGPRCRGRVHLGAPVAENLRAVAHALDRSVSDLVVVTLDRPRHEGLIADIRAAGARIRLIGDGDMAPAIGACVRGTGVHAVMGSGGAPEGELSAVAVRCLGGFMEGRLVEHGQGDRERAAKMGILDFDRAWTAEDLAPGEQLLFVATGVTTGDLLKGVDFFGRGARTHSVVLESAESRRVRFVDTVHVDDPVDVEIRL
jgi:fructose-1,6-bisphosphatase II